ncbi:hypothetical protein NYA9BBAC_02450 [Salinibacterium sp. NYA9b]
MLVAGGARAYPRGKLIGDRAAMEALALIAELFGDGFPLRSMAGTGASHRVRYLMQQDLVDLVILVPRSQIPGHGDAFVREVAEPRARLGVVEGELPAVIQVQSDERISPHAHSGKFSHLLRLIEKF